MSATISPTRAARQATDLDSHRLPLLWVGFVAASLNLDPPKHQRLNRICAGQQAN
jgi:hypothetical protein